MLKIKDIHAKIEEKSILNGINLEIKPGEVHAIMGPNGSRIHRFKVWQRAYWYNGPTGVPYYYQEENLRSFDLYASNNAQDWTLLGQFDIGDPSDGDGNIAENLLEAAADGHDFDLDGVSETFRYLKFSITSNYGSDTYCHGSEITLWGLDNLD